VTQRCVLRSFPDHVALTQPFDLDYRLAHGSHHIGNSCLHLLKIDQAAEQEN